MRLSPRAHCQRPVRQIALRQGRHRRGHIGGESDGTEDSRACGPTPSARAVHDTATAVAITSLIPNMTMTQVPAISRKLVTIPIKDRRQGTVAAPPRHRSERRRNGESPGRNRTVLEGPRDSGGPGPGSPRPRRRPAHDNDEPEHQPILRSMVSTIATAALTQPGTPANTARCWVDSVR